MTPAHTPIEAELSVALERAGAPLLRTVAEALAWSRSRRRAWNCINVAWPPWESGLSRLVSSRAPQAPPERLPAVTSPAGRWRH